MKKQNATVGVNVFAVLVFALFCLLVVYGSLFLFAHELYTVTGAETVLDVVRELGRAWRGE